MEIFSFLFNLNIEKPYVFKPDSLTIDLNQ
jgi:hypothetical protein